MAINARAVAYSQRNKSSVFGGVEVCLSTLTVSINWEWLVSCIIWQQSSPEIARAVRPGFRHSIFTHLHLTLMLYFCSDPPSTNPQQPQPWAGPVRSYWLFAYYLGSFFFVVAAIDRYQVYFGQYPSPKILMNCGSYFYDERVFCYECWYPGGWMQTIEKSMIGD